MVVAMVYCLSSKNWLRWIQGSFNLHLIEMLCSWFIFVSPWSSGLQRCVVMALPLANIDAHRSDLWLWRRSFGWSTTVSGFSAGSDYVTSCWLAYIYFCIWHFWLADVVMLSKETQYLRWCLRQTFVVLLPVPCLSRRWRGWMQTYVCNARMIMVAYVIVAGLLYERFASIFLCYFLPWCTTECFIYMHKWPGLIIMNPMYS